jgi:hypothetical protein
MKKTLSVILSIILIMTFAATSLGFASIAVKSIKLNSSKISLQIGKTLTLKVTITPADATNKKFTYSSGNKNIATIDKNGKIKGIKAGKTVITVTSSSNKKAAAKCNVTISQVYLSLLTYNVFTFGGNLPQWVNEKDDVVGKYLENKFKIKAGEVSNLSGMTFKERMNLFIASNDLPDVVCVFGDTVTCPSTGRYAELGDMIKQNCPNFMKYVPVDTWKDKLYNGRLYSMGALNINPLNYPNDPYAVPASSWGSLFTSESVLKKCGYSFTPLAEINKQINESGKKPTADLYKFEPEIKTSDDLYNFFKKIKETMPKVNGLDVIPFAIPIWL